MIFLGEGEEGRGEQNQKHTKPLSFNLVKAFILYKINLLQGTYHTLPFNHIGLHFLWQFLLSLENTQELSDLTATSSLKHLKPHHTSHDPLRL